MLSRNSHATVPAERKAPRVVPKLVGGRDAPPANLITADATRVSSSRFLARALSAFMPAPSETSEKADAARRFINASWGKSSDEIAELRAQFQREKAEIGKRYRAARDAASEVAL